MSEKKDILWLITGGTIDAEPYDGSPVDVKPQIPSVIQESLKALNLDHHCEYINICHEDSKNVTVDHLTQIVDTIDDHPEYRDIRISIGTDDLEECAAFIEQQIQNRGITGRTVMFVGAMEPLANDHTRESHAWKNLRKSVESAGQYDEGFYVIADETSKVKPLVFINQDGEKKFLSKDWTDRTFKYASSPFTRE